MKFGFQLARFHVPELPRRLAELAQRLEAAGFASLWLMDHLFQIDILGPPQEAMLEAYTTLGYLAAHTRTLQLGAMVTSVTFRHPGLLLKVATTLDALSGGRAWLGLGAGWFEREHRGLGIPFPTTAERFQRLEEVLQILQQPGQPYQGRYYQLLEPILQPYRRLPVLVGGMGEKKTLRLVAQYADACNFYQAAGREEIAAKLQVLKAHCQELKRDYQAIQKTTLGVYLPGQQQTFQEELRQLGSLGVSTAVIGLLDPWDRRHVEELIEVLGSFRATYSGP